MKFFVFADNANLTFYPLSSRTRVYLPDDIILNSIRVGTAIGNLLCEHRGFVLGFRFESWVNVESSTTRFFPTTLALNNLGSYVAFNYDSNVYNTFTGYTSFQELFSSSSIFDFFSSLCDYIIDGYLNKTLLYTSSDSVNLKNGFCMLKNFGWGILHSYTPYPKNPLYPYHGYYTYDVHGTDTIIFFDNSECCYPDFSPIVIILGGTPSPVQLENLKSICYLLGVNTAENGLKDCDLMKEYLKRLNQILGGSPYPEPNDNLKSICYLLGVDNSENGLKDCELSKDYVKRISKMLGAE